MKQIKKNYYRERIERIVIVNSNKNEINISNNNKKIFS